MKEYDKWQNFKITEQERQQLKQDAHRHGMNISEYLRFLIEKERQDMRKEDEGK
jgi:predicted DNA binding CopG/RHH family protein